MEKNLWQMKTFVNRISYVLLCCLVFSSCSSNQNDSEILENASSWSRPYNNFPERFFFEISTESGKEQIDSILRNRGYTYDSLSAIFHRVSERKLPNQIYYIISNRKQLKLSLFYSVEDPEVKKKAIQEINEILNQENQAQKTTNDNIQELIFNMKKQEIKVYLISKMKGVEVKIVTSLL